FVAVEHNPIDAVWHDRPAPPLAPMLPHPVEFAGETSEQRRRRIADIVAAKGADVALLSAPDSIAWLLNVRGGDVPRTPFALGFALLHKDGHVDLYMDRRKIPDRTVAWMGNAVTLAPPDELDAALDMLGKTGKRVLIETAPAPAPTERWCTTTPPRRPSARSNRARSISSIRARSIATARPTSPAPWRSARQRRR